MQHSKSEQLKKYGWVNYGFCKHGLGVGYPCSKCSQSSAPLNWLGARRLYLSHQEWRMIKRMSRLRREGKITTLDWRGWWIENFGVQNRLYKLMLLFDPGGGQHRRYRWCASLDFRWE